MNAERIAELRELAKQYNGSARTVLTDAVPDLLDEIERLREALAGVQNYEWEYDLDNIPEWDVKYLQAGPPGNKSVRAIHLPSGYIGRGLGNESALCSLKRKLAEDWIPRMKAEYAREIKPLTDIAREALAGVEEEG